MNNMKTKVQNKIRELVPELMELSSGCEVIAVWNSDVEKETDTLHATVLDRHEWKGWVLLHNYVRGTAKVKTEDVKEIIGHPIHLEHVLRAVEKVGKGNTYTFHLDLYMGGLAEFIRATDNKTMGYNLSLPFTEQSDELYQFLAEILDV